VADNRDNIDAMLAQARLAAADRHAHPAVQRISDHDWSAITSLVHRLCEALGPLHQMKGSAPLKEHIAAHRACLAKLTMPLSACMEAFTTLGPLGRVTLRDEGRTIAIGKIIELCPDK
jgi:translation elongation factor EF-1alpha